jgi:hypothetical protein
LRWFAFAIGHGSFARFAGSCGGSWLTRTGWCGMNERGSSWPPDRLRKIKGCSNMIYLSEKGVKFVLDIAIFLAGLAVIAAALYLTH